jgi:hypothetical protein
MIAASLGGVSSALFSRVWMRGRVVEGGGLERLAATNGKNPEKRGKMWVFCGSSWLTAGQV